MLQKLGEISRSLGAHFSGSRIVFYLVEDLMHVDVGLVYLDIQTTDRNAANSALFRAVEPKLALECGEL